MNRLAIFVLYDADGIIDDYVVYLLKSLKEIAAVLVAVNGALTEDSQGKIAPLADALVVRDNYGFDAGAWKDAITEYLDREQLKRYDELILLNDTFFGSFYPWANVWREMDEKYPAADFWGLTIHRKAQGGEIIEHLQSYFLVIRRRLLASDDFFAYWQQLPYFDAAADCAVGHELRFTAHFAALGYKYAALCDTRDGDAPTANPYLYQPSRLLKYDKFPIIKRKLLYDFAKATLQAASNGGEPRRCLEYIRANCDYDLGLIYQNILRRANIAAIRDALDLNYILPRQSRLTRPADCPPLKVAVAADLRQADYFAEKLEYLANLPDDTDIFLFTDSEKKRRELAERLKSLKRSRRVPPVRLAPPKREAAATLLVAVRPLLDDYDIFAFVHDGDLRRADWPLIAGRAVSEAGWENLLASPAYVENILARFAADDHLGLVVPPPPLFSNFRDMPNRGWLGNFANTRELLEAIGVNVPLDMRREPLSLGNMFWARRAALLPLLSVGWKADVFPAEPSPPDGTINQAFERCYPFVAQAAGYLTATAMTERVAANLYGLFRELYYTRQG